MADGRRGSSRPGRRSSSPTSTSTRMWLCRHYEHYFVALEETRVHLEELGVPAAKITVSAASRSTRPSPAEGQGRDARQVRPEARPDHRSWSRPAGSASARSTALIASLCGSGTRRRSWRSAAGTRSCKARLDAQAAGLPPDSAGHAQGRSASPTRWTSTWPRPTCCVGKPGGLTTSEALARGLVFVIVNPIPGQEERNSRPPAGGRGGDPLQQPPGARLQDRPPARRPGAARRPCGRTRSASPAPRGLRRRRPAVRVGGDGLTGPG